MDIKTRPNHKAYIEVLRSMTPEQRLLKAVELTETANALFKAGLRNRFPDLTDDRLHALYLERLAKCHNRNY